MVPGPSRGTILNTTSTCSTVHYMPCPQQCSVTESWQALALTPQQIWERHVTRGIICVSSLLHALHAWRVPRPKGPRVGAIHVMRGMRGFWHVAMDLLFSSAARGAY